MGNLRLTTRLCEDTSTRLRPLCAHTHTHTNTHTRARARVLLRFTRASHVCLCVPCACRWGQVYGGRQWRWPWSLTDMSGLTALHHAAFHSQATACTALLATLRRMVPTDTDSAHAAWLRDPGSLGVTPCEMYAKLHPQNATDKVWGQRSLDNTKPPSNTQLEVLAATWDGSSAYERTGSCSTDASGATLAYAAGTSKAESMGGGEGVGGGLGVRSGLGNVGGGDLPGFWSLMREAWRWKQHPEYHAWALKNVSDTPTHIHTHTCAHARAHTHTHTHTRAHI